MHPSPNHAHWRGGSATDRLFIVAVVIKGVDGALGIIGGILLALVHPAMLTELVRILTTHELSKNPNDIIANDIVHWAAGLDVSKLAFAAAYLGAHGVMKLFLSIMLLMGRPWSYPVAAVFLFLFMSYTGYRLILHWSWFLPFFLFLDLFTFVLVLREWRTQIKRWEAEAPLS